MSETKIENKTENKRKRLFTLKSLPFWILFCLIWFVSVFIYEADLSASSADFVHKFIFPVYAGTFGRFFSLFPNLVDYFAFVTPASRIIALLLIAFLIITIIRKIKKKPPLLLQKIMLYTMAVLFLIVTIFLNPIYYVLYYKTTPIEEQLGLNTADYSYEDLRDFYEVAKGKLNELSVQVPRDENGNVIFDDFTLCKEAVKNSNIPLTNGFMGKVYPFPNSLQMLANGVAGELDPVTLQIKISDRVPLIPRISSTCHEYAHARGYSRENEAEFISYVSCIQSDNIVLQYSGWLEALNSLKGLENEADPFIDKSEFTEEYRHDIDNINAELDKAAEDYAASVGLTVEEVDEMNRQYIENKDAEMKENGADTGIAAYDQSVYLLMAYLDTQKN
jgi:hypothetical protein